MTRIIFFFTFVSLLAPGPLSARAENPVAARLLVDAGPAGVRAGVEFTIPEGWHIGWESTGEIGLPTEVSFSGDGNPAAFGPVRRPLPREFVDAGGPPSLGHDGTVVVWSATPPGVTPSAVTAEAKWLSCSERACVPGRFREERTIRDGGSSNGRPSPDRAALDRAEAASPSVRDPAGVISTVTGTVSEKTFSPLTVRVSDPSVVRGAGVTTFYPVPLAKGLTVRNWKTLPDGGSFEARIARPPKTGDIEFDAVFASRTPAGPGSVVRVRSAIPRPAPDATTAADGPAGLRRDGAPG